MDIILTHCGFFLVVCNSMQSSYRATSVADGLLHEVHFGIWFVSLLLQLLILCIASFLSVAGAVSNLTYMLSL